jgi:hypothetical protein
VFDLHRSSEREFQHLSKGYDTAHSIHRFKSDNQASRRQWEVSASSMNPALKSTIGCKPSVESPSTGENHVVVNIDDWMFPMVSDSGADRRGYIELSFAKVKNQFCILEIIFPARIERLSERK